MKLLVCALVSDFGNSRYSISMLYGNANSKDYPLIPPSITDKSVLEMACKFSREIILPKGSVRNSAFFYDSRTGGSYVKATSIELLLGRTVSNNLILARFDDLSINELNTLLANIKSIAENHVLNGKFTRCGKILNLSHYTIG